MSLYGGIDGPRRIGEDPIDERAGGIHEERRTVRTWRVATGTLACPACDAPVAPEMPLAPAEEIACPFCEHGAPVREFLTLGEPTRPTRVAVRVIPPARVAAR
jgi:hypothetical protein